MSLLGDEYFRKNRLVNGRNGRRNPELIFTMKRFLKLEPCRSTNPTHTTQSFAASPKILSAVTSLSSSDYQASGMVEFLGVAISWGSEDRSSDSVANAG